MVERKEKIEMVPMRIELMTSALLAEVDRILRVLLVPSSFIKENVRCNNRLR